MKRNVPREEELFDTALHLRNQEERAAYLKARCEGDIALRTRIEALLSAHAEADAFFSERAPYREISPTIEHLHEDLQKSGHHSSRSAETAERVGDTIGRYKLIEHIGEGGCGAVYLALQEEPVRRKVALKIIKSGMCTKSVITRFEAERQALAMMDHPNIARVFDAGETRSGLPFFVMEHVRGVRLTDYCDQHKLPVKQRLNLFIQVCHAIQHAHQNCIVHGDIKPSNIMVSEHDGEPVPKVIDFGISKATESRIPERHPHLASARLVGTPAYMSPEQVETEGQEIDTRSDIYSLGVLLYELLAGQTPLDGHLLAKASIEEIRELFEKHALTVPSELLRAQRPEVRRARAEARRASPGTLFSQIKGDLDCIAMKALEKDRRRRYETANALASDIIRYLHEEPVSAHPSKWLYRTGKLVRRNRGMVLASVAVASVLVLGMGISTWLFIKERDARQRAVAAEEQQVRLREEAELREQLTQAALLVSQEKFEEADLLIRDIALNESTLEGAAVFRAIGEWHALNGRWRQAADRFDVLLRINHLEGSDVSSLDYLELGPVLVELGNLQAYEEFRDKAVARFMGKQNPFTDRIVKISLLKPAERQLLEALLPLAEFNAQAAIVAERMGDSFAAAWRSMSMALYEYRSGNFENALNWCLKSIQSPDSNDPRTATVRAILAMSQHRLGQADKARMELDRARELISSHEMAPFERGSPVNGFWFDWAFARILIREAANLMEPAPLRGP